MPTMFAIISSLVQAYDTVKHILRLPRAVLCFDSKLNASHIDATYRAFTKRHPKYLIIKNKTIGAALIDTDDFGYPENYVKAFMRRSIAGRNAKRAKKRGYRFVQIDRNAFVDDIHRINTSLPYRQGRPMSASYQQRVNCFVDLENYRYYGILDKEGKLIAYCDVGLYGNFALLSRLLGYRNNDGVMHLMIVEIVVALMREGAVRFVMYDMYFGASEGLRNFKTILGFKPYRVTYSIA
jgi:hypothetical protein